MTTNVLKLYKFSSQLKDFMDYTFGIYEGGCSSDPKRANHGVLIVGYDKSKHENEIKNKLKVLTDSEVFGSIKFCFEHFTTY